MRKVLFFIVLILTIGISGCSSDSQNTTQVPTTPVVAQPVQQPTQAQSKSATEASNPSPPSQQELLDNLSWTNDQFNTVYMRFQGLQPGTPQQMNMADPEWPGIEVKGVDALWAKLASIKGTMDSMDLKNPIPRLLQADVETTIGLAASAVGDMAEYLDSNGGTSQEEVNKDISDYNSMYSTVLKEVQQGKMIDKN